MFISRDRREILQRAVMGPADLVAEVVSLGGRQRDRIEKRDLHEQYGVREYWIIDPEPRTVEVLALESARPRCPQQTRTTSIPSNRPSLSICPAHWPTPTAQW
jgi:Uma2 family endonuclease